MATKNKKKKPKLFTDIPKVIPPEGIRIKISKRRIQAYWSAVARQMAENQTSHVPQQNYSEVYWESIKLSLVAHLQAAPFKFDKRTAEECACINVMVAKDREKLQVVSWTMSNVVDKQTLNEVKSFMRSIERSKGSITIFRS